MEKAVIMEDGKHMMVTDCTRKFFELAFTPVEKPHPFYKGETILELPYQYIIISEPKKGGKTLKASVIGAWYSVCMAVPEDEIYIVANSEKQALTRAYLGMRRILKRNPELRSAVVTDHDKGVELVDGTRILPITTAFAAEAGANPSLVLWDEMHGAIGERFERLDEEMTPVIAPNRPNSFRVITSYAGWRTESSLLWRYYDLGVNKGDRISDEYPFYENKKASLLCYWDSGPEARRNPWQRTEKAKREFEAARTVMPKRRFERIWLNLWQDSEFGIDMDHWDNCVQNGTRLGHTREMAPSKKIKLVVGIDAAYRRDQAAIETVFRKDRLLWRGPRYVWTPPGRGKTGELDMEETLEKAVLELRDRYNLREVLYDPSQMVYMSQRLRKKGIRMREFSPQNENNVRLMASTFLDALRWGYLILDDDPELRAQAERTVVEEGPKGQKLGKSKKNAKVDRIMALAMAVVAGQELPDQDFSVASQMMVLDPQRDAMRL